MEGCARDFESDGSTAYRRSMLLGWLHILDGYLDAQRLIHGHRRSPTMPKALARRLWDISIGKVDPIFKSQQGGSSLTLGQYELQRRALLASKAIRRAGGLSEKEADEWVFARIKATSSEIFPRAKQRAAMIDDWRRGLRRRAKAQPRSLQDTWGRIEIKGVEGFAAPEPLWREALRFRRRGRSWEDVAVKLLDPFTTQHRQRARFAVSTNRDQVKISW